MQVTQIYTIMNNVQKEILGDTSILNEDLSNIVDIGNAIFDAVNVDNYVHKLVDHVGKVAYVDRDYKGSVPSVLMDSWEFGSILEKIQVEMPEATENESWDLVDGQTYNQDVFHKPTVSAKFFNSRVTFEVDISFTDKQAKESFSNIEQLNGFLSMIFNSVDKSITVKLDALIMRTINNMILQVVDDEFPTIVDNNYGTVSGVKAVNVLKEYNTLFTKTLTPSSCLMDKDFIKYCSYIMGLYTDRLTRMSTLFNAGGKQRFTPLDKLHCVMLSHFEKSAGVYLDSDTFHNETVKLPKHETVPYWQGTGTKYEFENCSKIHATIKTGETTKEITFGGVIGVMFDHEALGVSNLDKRVTSHPNAKGEFFNNFYKNDAGYFNDLDENFVLFYVA